MMPQGALCMTCCYLNDDHVLTPYAADADKSLKTTGLFTPRMHPAAAQSFWPLNGKMVI